MFKSLIICLQLFSALWPRQTDTLNMLFLGDIMQHSSQLQSSYRGVGDRTDPNSYSYLPYFKYLESYFQKNHIVAANMETTFAPAPYSGYPVFCSPSSLARDAMKAGVNLFFAANNHSVDKGSRGLKETISLYEKLDILYTGIYLDESHEGVCHPLIIEKKGIKVAVLNYTYGTNGIDVPWPYVVKQLDSAAVKKDLLKASLLEPDCIIVSVHWGDEYKTSSGRRQKKWEALFYKYGANLVIGSHPHVPQEVVSYKDSIGRVKAITAFSLGNAISNMSAKNTRIGIMLEVKLIKEAYTGNTWFDKPDIHYIWTSRPRATGGYYTIIPIKDYLQNPGNYNVKGENVLIENYFKKFTTNQKLYN